jgi:uncharacterized protein YfaP (DUF2135 family)
MLTSLGLVGCGGGGSGQPKLSPEQIAQIETASQTITDKLQQADDPTSTDALQAAKAAAESQAMVQSAAVVDNQLVVQYKDAGREIWVMKSLPFTPPADLAEVQALTRSITGQAKTSRAPVGNRNAVLINALFEDRNCSDYDSWIGAFQAMHDILVAKGFNVTDLNGASASPDNLKGLAGDSVIVMLGHGCRWFGTVPVTLPYSVQTGQEWNRIFIDSTDWLMNRLVCVHVPWGSGDNKERAKHSKSFVAVTGRFWRDSYASSHFNKALFMNLACSGAKHPAYRDDLFGVGATAYTGWTDEQSVSPYTAWRTLALMATGKNLREAVDDLPSDYKSRDYQDETRAWTAELWCGPEEGLSITLGGNSLTGPNIIINSPSDGQTITSHSCVVEGSISPWPGNIQQTTIAVNGASTALSVDSDGYFSQEVGIRSGANTIRISAISLAEDTAEVNVTGDFSSEALWTKLSWNTDLNDIDLHLVPVEGANGLRDDCYYGHMVSEWGAVLDVDDVNGYGPEHITAATLPDGKYKLFVYYYSTHGQMTAAVVSVLVSVNGGQTKNFQLPAMRDQDDIWEVCYISFPSGNVETINSYIPASRAPRISYPAKHN